jgi:hypothetical protein
MSATSNPIGRKASPQKLVAMLATGWGGAIFGSKSNGLTVAHRVLVAILR